LALRSRSSRLTICSPSDGWSQLKASDSDDEKKGVYLTDEEELEVGGGSKSLVHFLFSWPDSKKQSSVTLVEVKGVTGPYTVEQSGTFGAVLALDCKGCEPTAWYPSADFDVRSVKGTLFEGADLSSGEWTEYDEAQKDAELANLSVMELRHDFKVHSAKK